jgi:hypothetical protein
MRLTPRHIPFARLADLAEGRLGAGERAEAEAHLSACARCAGQAAELRRVTQLMRADTSARQMLYGAGDFDIDLRLAPGEEGWTVSGQVLGPCEAGGRVEISGGGGRAEAALNELCEFTLRPLPSGAYTLLLTVAGVEVEVPELSLQA